MRIFKMVAEGKLCIVLLYALCTTLLLGTTIAAQPADARSVKYDLDIPSQNLNDALQALALASQHKLLYSSELVEGKKSPALKGQFTTEQAVKALLSGTNLRYQVTSDGLVLIRAEYPPPATNSVPLTSGGGSDPSIRLAQAASPSTDNSANKTNPQNTNLPTSQSSISSESEKDKLSEIVVTGSHIRGIQPIAPMQMVTREDIDISGYSQVGDLVRSVPENFGGGQNPGVMNTGGGASTNLTNASTVNLRGLGPDATLTLLNGHRLASDAIFAAPDISGIPLAAIDHIEILTDGASALYGSDAVAGVVNFILRKDYDGAEASATEGRATQGGGFEQDYNVLGGRTWGNGHALASIEFADQNPILTSQRSITADAPLGNDLLAGQTRKSVFADVDQELTDWASVHIDGLYSSRQAEQTVQLSTASTAYMYDLGTSSYLIDPGVTFKLPAEWNGYVDGSIARAGDNDSYLSSEGSRNDTFYTNSTKSVEASASGPIARLPSGELNTAFGAGYRREDFTTNGMTSARTTVQSVSRDVSYAFAEALLPLVTPSEGRFGLQKLDLSLAGRIENYSDFGTTSNPKLGIRYVPLEGFTLRGTWGKSFKAPTFYQLFSEHNIEYFNAQLFGSSRSGNALVDYGGNPDLKPERAKSWTAGIDWSPPSIPSLDVSVTYFDIDYTNRITFPITSPLTSLSNPIFAPFVISNPTPSQLATLIASTPIFENFSGAAYNPAQTIDVLEDRYTNATAQQIDGVDLSAKKSVAIARGDIAFFVNATWLRLTQQTISTVPAVTLTGTLFQPPKARVRSGLTWTYDGFTVTGIVNYISDETDTNVTPSVAVASWTTFDLNFAYRVRTGLGVLSGLEASLAITNAFDRDPPYAKGAALQAQGVYFDSTNTSALGRFVALTLRKRF